MPTMASVSWSASRATACTRARSRASATTPGTAPRATASSASSMALALREGRVVPVLAGVQAGPADDVLELGEALAQRPDLVVLPALDRLRGPAGEERVVAPPVQAHLAGGLGGGDEQAQLEREQFDVEHVHHDVARDDDALVEHPLEHVGQGVGLAAERAGADTSDAADGRFGAHA